MITWLGLPVQTARADVDETPHPGESPDALAVRLARAKAHALAPSLDDGWHFALAADTTVDLDGLSLGKPASAAEAQAMLRRLRSRTHQVHTGVALRAADGNTLIARRVTTEVRMRAYSEAEVAAYIASGDPLDKAGGYAIQHPEFQPVAQVERCYANVVGLPLCAITAMLADCGYEIAGPMADLCRRHFAYRCPVPDAGVAL